MSSEVGSWHPASQPRQKEVEEDLQALSPSALRAKYKGEASSHANMKARCKSGFSLDPAWAEFRDFLGDMGPRPYPGWSIDRISHGDRRYGPGLCRWASNKEQTENRSNTIWVEYEGQELTLADLARRFGVAYSTLYSAYSKGSTADQLAARFAPRSALYHPDYLGDDEMAHRLWHDAYNAWKSKIAPEQRWIAEPEVFDLITCSRLLKAGRVWLEDKGFFELTAEEHSEAEALLATAYGIAWQHGHQRIRTALKALARRAPTIAVRVTRAGQTFEHFIRLGAWLEKPPPPSMTTFRS